MSHASGDFIHHKKTSEASVALHKSTDGGYIWAVKFKSLIATNFAMF